MAEFTGLETKTRQGVMGENCQWQFARKPSDENLFSIAKFRGREVNEAKESTKYFLERVNKEGFSR